MFEKFHKEFSLRHSNSWLVGGAAEFFYAPTDIEDFKNTYVWANQQKIPISILGGGTNVLISDSGVEGLVLSTKNLKKIHFEVKVGRANREELHILAEAGVAKSDLLRIFLQHKLAPALFLGGLPGDVGGGVVMNAGVGEDLNPREFCEIVDRVHVLRVDGSIDFVEAKQIQWDYRKCLGWQPGVVVAADLSWPIDPEEDIPKLVRDLNKNRLLKQPLDFPSCGSVFRNPEGDFAGRLIQSVGLKGHRVGGAQISEKHANFIINTGDALASDIFQLIQLVQKTVKEKVGIDLHTEVVTMGRGFCLTTSKAREL